MDLDAVTSLLNVAASPLLQAANATAASTMTSMSGSASGNLLLDGLLLACVPLGLQFLLSPAGVNDAWKRVRSALVGDPDAGFVFRDVKATTTYGEYWVQNEDANRFGHLLQKAILTHLADVLASELRGKDIRYEMVERELDDDVAQVLEDAKPTNTDEYEWTDEGRQSKQYEAINRLRVGAMPKHGEWIEVQPQVFFQQCAASVEDDDADSGGGGGGDDKRNVSKTKDISQRFRFKSNALDGTKKIDKLIEEAFVKFQLLELTKLASDKKKYMFVQTHKATEALSSGGDDDNDKSDGASTTAAVVYKRYALGEEKTFTNLFFEEKRALVQLLDNFMAHSGKFAIPGFPYKLGLLLHGPPGTGKTSLIKAVAQHTKRHIVTISLGKIKTNQELMNALFDLRFNVEGVALPVNMTFEDVVFVMEDIDCAASVVMARENKTKASNNSRSTGRYKRPSSQWSSNSASDKLNLSGLLNVLDGVIDCPGRIVIMTTNHPEKLDPALIRPGRVNKKLELGYMNRVNIQKMVEYYSQESFTAEQEKVLDAIGSTESGKKITPATVEALSAEFDDIAEVLNALELLQSGAGPESSETWMS